MQSDVKKWSPQSVEKWLCNRHKIRIGICGAFRMQEKVDGVRLLSLTKPEIVRICRKARANLPEIKHVTKLILELQQTYQIDLEKAERKKKRKLGHSSRYSHIAQCQRPRKRARTDRDGLQSESSHSYSTNPVYQNEATSTHNISNSGKLWTEEDIREAWEWWLKCRDFQKVATMIRRTEVATLSKINLIRRAIHESGDELFEKELMQPGKQWRSLYSFTAIVRDQKEKELEQSQKRRLQENGVNTDDDINDQSSTASLSND